MAATGGTDHATSAMAERGAVLDALEQLLADAAQGRGGALFVVGAAGLGKTTVLQHAITMAGPRFLVGVGCGDQVERVLPFGLISQALDQILDGGSAGSAMTSDTDGGDTPGVSAQARFYGILRGVREAAVFPLLVALDDLHWSDPDSLTVIHLICRRLATLPVALIATARPWPADAMTSAHDLAAQGLARIEPVVPLSAAAARDLLSSRVTGQLPPEVVDQAVDKCGGNPLLVEQVALELRRNGQLPEGTVWFTRFAGVGAAGRRYLQAASVLGTRFRAAVAVEMAGCSAAEAAAEIDGLFRGGLLHDAGQGWAQFTHALIRQGVYDDISPPVRENLHAAAFRALVASGAYPAEAAAHAVAAELAGDPQAVATVARAGRAALRAGAVQAARRHLEAAARLAGDTAPTELLFDLGAALVADGASDLAIASYERLLDVPELPIADRIAALRELWQACNAASQVQRAAACIETAVGLAEQDHPALAVGALLDQAFHDMAFSGPRAALASANRAAGLATTSGVMQASALAAQGAFAYRCGDPDSLASAAAAATRVDLIPTSRSMDRHRYRHPALTYATVAVYAERFTDAERLLTEILNSAERRCEPITLLQAATAWTDGLCRLGRLAEAAALADRLLELAELLPRAAALAISYRALVLLEQGELEQAAHCFSQPTKIHNDGHNMHHADGLECHVRGVLAYRQGDTETACALFTQLQEWAERTGEVDPSYLPWACDAVAAHLASGRDSDAQRVIDWVTLRGRGLPTRWPKIVVATGQAALAERSGDRSIAESRFTRALELHDELPMPLARAQTLTDFGAFLTRGGEIPRARALLAEAMQIAETCGAGWHAGRARAQWRRAGGRARSHKPDELSPQESAVAQLAMIGRTNRDIAQQLHLSIKTVETHLGHVYQKLGIRSRWQLKAWGADPKGIGPRPAPHG
ncbi:MAG: helix-turn-helix transcriptional regulator [Pseudonocardiaceae bacterium]